MRVLAFQRLEVEQRPFACAVHHVAEGLGFCGHGGGVSWQRKGIDVLELRFNLTWLSTFGHAQVHSRELSPWNTLKWIALLFLLSFILWVTEQVLVSDAFDNTFLYHDDLFYPLRSALGGILWVTNKLILDALLLRMNSDARKSSRVPRFFTALAGKSTSLSDILCNILRKRASQIDLPQKDTK